MQSLALITPVHGREDLTRLCLEQRRRVLDELADRGIDVWQVVVGCDGNLDTARDLGFEVLERPNELGRKVNDGIEFACGRGADVIGYIGSDDWVTADRLAELPVGREIVVGTWEAVVSPDGRRLVVRDATTDGSTPWLIPRDLLAASGYRPADDWRMSGIDGSIRRSIRGVREPRSRRHRVDVPRVAQRRVATDELQRVGFKGGGQQITPFQMIVPRARRRIHRDEEPFQALADVYPVDLVERMADFYAAKERLAA